MIVVWCVRTLPPMFWERHDEQNPRIASGLESGEELGVRVEKDWRRTTGGSSKLNDQVYHDL